MHPYIVERITDQKSQPQSAPEPKGVLQRWTTAIWRKMQRRKMISELHAMDDRILRDIGIYRCEIERVVNGFDDRELRMAPVARDTIASHAKPVLHQKAA